MLLQNWNMTFLKFFIWYRIVGTCFFEEFHHRDRRIEFYLENHNGLLRKRTHLCLLEQSEWVGLERKEERRERRKENLVSQHPQHADFFSLTMVTASGWPPIPSCPAPIHSTAYRMLFCKTPSLFRTPSGLPILLEHMHSLHHGPWSRIDCPCPLSSLILHNPRLGALWPHWPSQKLPGFPGPLHFSSCPLSLLHFPLYSALSLVPFSPSDPNSNATFLQPGVLFCTLTVLCTLPSHHLSQSTTCYISNL